MGSVCVSCHCAIVGAVDHDAIIRIAQVQPTTTSVEGLVAIAHIVAVNHVAIAHIVAVAHIVAIAHIVAVARKVVSARGRVLGRVLGSGRFKGKGFCRRCLVLTILALTIQTTTYTSNHEGCKYATTDARKFNNFFRARNALKFNCRIR